MLKDNERLNNENSTLKVSLENMTTENERLKEQERTTTQTSVALVPRPQVIIDKSEANIEEIVREPTSESLLDLKKGDSLMLQNRHFPVHFDLKSMEITPSTMNGNQALTNNSSAVENVIVQKAITSSIEELATKTNTGESIRRPREEKVKENSYIFSTDSEKSSENEIKPAKPKKRIKKRNYSNIKSENQSVSSESVQTTLGSEEEVQDYRIISNFCITESRFVLLCIIFVSFYYNYDTLFLIHLH